MSPRIALTRSNEQGLVLLTAVQDPAAGRQRGHTNDELGLIELVTSIAGLAAVGATTILAETGEFTSFRGPRLVVKRAGRYL